MVGGDGVGHLLQQDGLTGLGLGHDQAALSLADGGEEVHDAGRDGAAFVPRDVELLVREQGREVVEGDAVAHFLGTASVDEVGLDEREEFLASLGRTDDTHDGVAGLQTHQLDLRLRHIDVVGRRQVVVVRRAQESEAFGHDFEHALGTHGAVELVQQVVAARTLFIAFSFLAFLLGLCRHLFLHYCVFDRCGLFLHSGCFFLCFRSRRAFGSVFVCAFAFLLGVLFLLASGFRLGLSPF